MIGHHALTEIHFPLVNTESRDPVTVSRDWTAEKLVQNISHEKHVE